MRRHITDPPASSLESWSKPLACQKHESDSCAANMPLACCQNLLVGAREVRARNADANTTGHAWNRQSMCGPNEFKRPDKKADQGTTEFTMCSSLTEFAMRSSWACSATRRLQMSHVGVGGACAPLGGRVAQNSVQIDIGSGRTLAEPTAGQICLRPDPASRIRPRPLRPHTGHLTAPPGMSKPWPREPSGR